ncbi:DUF721 domain-containing protein [Geobacter hydrogenophilus]|uniref:Uncharacterized protein n=1 Tax=Geobacter hydrogenophilus TaxID=40983 RepID=A0A9W6FYF6_9BACT|nr:DUF721 domain-containing protein [Geobacter hydrogenophilus]MBT0894792.1 DUF721 domain-containing protein [Geobacter hydrogenophilus]GLI37370.1 hypothetical protein GHYDROH2_08710 [Geobacter hydrogenophilus]
MGDARSRMPRPRPVADLLTEALRGKPAERRLKEGRIWLLWDEAVGERIASLARPVGFRDGTLTVAVANAPWMQQLNFLKGGIVEKLNTLLGGPVVRDIYLKAGRTVSPVEAPPERRPPPRELTRAEREFVASETESVEDPELREIISHLMAKHLASKPTGEE